MIQLFSRFIRDDEGQDLIEYALLGALISLVAVLAITAVGTGVNNAFVDINDQVENGGPVP